MWRLEAQQARGQSGFYSLARQRWVVRTTNAWNRQDGENSKDYERKPVSSTAMIQL